MTRFYLRSPPEVTEAIGAQAKALRKRRGLSQEQLAERAGLSRRTIQRFEDSGTLTLQGLVQIAFALGVPDSFDELFAQPAPTSIDEVLAMASKKKRGSR